MSQTLFLVLCFPYVINSKCAIFFTFETSITHLECPAPAFYPYIKSMMWICIIITWLDLSQASNHTLSFHLSSPTCSSSVLCPLDHQGSPPLCFLNALQPLEPSCFSKIPGKSLPQEFTWQVSSPPEVFSQMSPRDAFGKWQTLVTLTPPCFCLTFLQSSYHHHLENIYKYKAHIFYCMSPSIKIQALWEWEISSLWFTDAAYKKSPENSRHWINICWISKWSWCFSFSGLFGKHIMVYDVDLTSPQRLRQGGMVQG